MAYTISLKVKLYRSAAVGWVWYDKAWRDDKKITLEDIDETIYAAGAMLLIWPEFAAPLLASPPAIAIEAIVVAGFVASVAIGGFEGGERYIEYITEPEKYIERGAPPVQEYITEPIIDYVTEELWQKQLVEPIGGWLSRRERDVKRVWEITRPRKPSWL